MLSIDDLRFFATVALSRSLTAAARDLRVTPPAVTQRLRQLEARLRVSLVERSTRHLRLTAEGQLLAERGRLIMDDVSELTNDLSARQGDVTGQLRIVAPFGLGRRYIAPVAADFCRDHPRVTLSLMLSESPARIGTDSWDLLIHAGELRDSSLRIHRLAPNDRIVCAAPDYLARRGEPRRPEDLRKHDCAVLKENDEDVTLWRLRTPGGDVRSVRIDPRFASNDGEIIRGWALAGLGIIARSEWDIADDIKAGRLVRILGDHQLGSADIVALLGARVGRTARTARFLDYLTAAFSYPAWRS